MPANTGFPAAHAAPLKAALTALALCAALAGCARGPLAPDAYRGYLTDASNGLHVSEKAEADGLEFHAQYNPPAWQAYAALRGENPDPARIREQAAAYEGLYNFTFRIENKAGGQPPLKRDSPAPAEYARRLAYCDGGELARDFRLAAGPDTLAPVACVFDHDLGIGPFHNVTLAFPRPPALPEGAGLELIYNDRLFTRRTYRFAYEPGFDQSLPEIAPQR